MFSGYKIYHSGVNIRDIRNPPVILLSICAVVLTVFLIWLLSVDMYYFGICRPKRLAQCYHTRLLGFCVWVPICLILVQMLTSTWRALPSSSRLQIVFLPFGFYHSIGRLLLLMAIFETIQMAATILYCWTKHQPLPHLDATTNPLYAASFCINSSCTCDGQLCIRYINACQLCEYSSVIWFLFILLYPCLSVVAIIWLIGPNSCFPKAIIMGANCNFSWMLYNFLIDTV